MPTLSPTLPALTPGGEAPLPIKAPADAAVSQLLGAAPPGEQTQFFRALVEFLSGSARLMGGKTPPAGALSGGSLPAAGKSLPPELSDQDITVIAAALGVDPAVLKEALAAVHVRGQQEAALEMATDAGGQRAAQTLPVRADAAAAMPGALRSDQQLAPDVASQRPDPGMPVMTRDVDLGGRSNPQPDPQALFQAAVLHKALEQGRVFTVEAPSAAPKLIETRPGDGIALGVGLSTAAPAAGGAERSPAPLALSTPFSHPQWGEEVGQRIRWMVNSNLQTAELKINPPQLGPVEIRINVQNEHMTVTFTAQHALVREALQDAAPRLRELMGENGFASVDVNVSDQSSPRDNRAGEEQNGAALRSAQLEDAAPDSASAWSTLGGARGLVDYYA